MNADVLLANETLHLLGHVVANNDETELLVTGAVAGYAMHDRKNNNVRYVVYANDGKLSIYKDGFGNILTISEDSFVVNVQQPGPITIGSNGPVEKKETHQIDILKELRELSNRISALEGQHNGRPAPLNPGTNTGNPIHIGK